MLYLTNNPENQTKKKIKNNTQGEIELSSPLSMGVRYAGKNFHTVS
jgi:hypothetical protein